MKRYDNNLDGTLDEADDGRYVEHADHLAAIQQLTDRLAQVEKERDRLAAEVEELKKAKTCDTCAHDDKPYRDKCQECFKRYWRNDPDLWEPRATGGGDYG